MRIIQRAIKSLGMLEARAISEPALHPRGAETCREDLGLLLSCGSVLERPLLAQDPTVALSALEESSKKLV